MEEIYNLMPDQSYIKPYWHFHENNIALYGISLHNDELVIGDWNGRLKTLILSEEQKPYEKGPSPADSSVHRYHSQNENRSLLVERAGEYIYSSNQKQDLAVIHDGKVT